MKIDQFARKILRKLIVYCILLFLVSMLLSFADIFLQNQLALGQMAVSGEAGAAAMGLISFQRLRPMIFFLMWVVFTGVIVRDTHKFHKTKGEKSV